MIETYVLGSKTAQDIDTDAADVDLDGEVTLRDAELIYQFNNSLIKSLPFTGEAERRVYPDPANYEIINEGMTWQEAENKCESSGGHLAVITSHIELAMIQYLIGAQSGKKNNYWIGLKKDNEGKFCWVTDEKVDYTNWNANCRTLIKS